MANGYHRVFKALGAEWERVVLVTMLVIGLGLLVPGGVKLASLLRRPPEGHMQPVRVPPFFNDARAWAFLTPTPGPQIGKDHIFRVAPPAGWRPPPRQDLTPLVIIKQPDKKPDITPPPPPKREPPKPEPPPKPVLHFYVFKGVGKSPEGHPLAYVIDERSQGSDRKRAGSRFLQEGDEMGAFTVVSFTPESLVLKNAATGETAEIVNGDRFQYATTPGDAKPDGAKPGGAKPGGAKPGGAKPDGAKPGGPKPDGAKPGGKIPDAEDADGEDGDGEDEMNPGERNPGRLVPGRVIPPGRSRAGQMTPGMPVPAPGGAGQR